MKLLVGIAVLIVIVPAYSTQLTCQVPSANYSTIQSAVDDNNCDSIHVDDGTYFENVRISRSVMISGAGEDSTFMDANNVGTVITILQGAAEVSISNLIIQNGGLADSRGEGSGVLLAGTGQVVLENITIRDNEGIRAGGIIQFEQGKLILRDVTIINNIGSAAGGIGAQQNADISIDWDFENVDIISNSGNLAGGLFISLPAPINPDLQLAEVRMTNVLISQNSSATSGGGISIGGTRFSGEMNLTMRDVTISENTALEGGGLLIDPKSILDIENIVIEGNIAGKGAGIFFRSTPSIPADPNISEFNNVIFENNVAINEGGAIYNASGRTILFNDTTLQNNRAFSGGAIFNEGSLEIRDSLIAGNEANDGGAIRNNSELTISSSTLQGNSAEVGGAIFNKGTVSLLNVTLAENTSATLGGAIFNEEGGAISVTFVTINGSSALSGAGLFNSGGTIFIKNSLLANSLSGGNCALGIKSEGHNLSSDGSCLDSFTLSSDFNNIDPLLDPSGLRNNGGSAATIALLAESIAIDAIAIEECTDMNGNLVTADQRGAFRPQGVGCDIGAYEAEQ
jgi:predicted outer membrane repeat protein